jgi:hypothetical protein
MFTGRAGCYPFLERDTRQVIDSQDRLLQERLLVVVADVFHQFASLNAEWIEQARQAEQQLGASEEFALENARASLLLGEQRQIRQKFLLRLMPTVRGGELKA